MAELQPLLGEAQHDGVDRIDGFQLLKNREIDLVIVQSLTPNVVDYVVNGGVFGYSQPQKGYMIQ